MVVSRRAHQSQARCADVAPCQLVLGATDELYAAQAARGIAQVVHDSGLCEASMGQEQFKL
jgi:hypothetical protein